MGPLPWGNLAVASYQYGGHLIPRRTPEHNAVGLGDALRNITEAGVIIVCVSMNVSHSTSVSNAIFPALRNAAVTMQIGTPWNETAPWSEMLRDQYKLTNTCLSWKLLLQVVDATRTRRTSVR